MKIYCGIDLGTTNSTASVIKLSNRRESPMESLKTYPIYQYDANFKYTRDSIALPSAIYFDIEKDRVYTGEYAKKIYASGDRPMQTIRSIKTRIGGESMIEIPGINDPDRVEYFEMAQCSALLLKTIKQSLEIQLGEEIEEVTVTVPAAFNNDERQATINAILLAGFKSYHILDEPTAALLYYINGGEGDLIEEDEIAEEGEYRLVYDIGGGTLDVSIAKIAEDDFGDIEIDIVARSPRMDFGGDDFDQYLAAYFLSEFERVRTPIENYSKEDQNRIIARIVSQAEKEKIEINGYLLEAYDNARRLQKVSSYVQFEIIKQMSIPETKLTKVILEAVFSDLILGENSVVLKPIIESLKEAKLSKQDITEVIVTGGMSNFYVIEEVLRNYFGNEVRLIKIDSVTAVSKGAALYHYSADDNEHEEVKKLQLKDRMADDIFIKVGNDFKVLISRDTEQMNGTFEYDVFENGLASLPIFLYYGTGMNPAAYMPLAGQFLLLNRKYVKGEKIQLIWERDEDKMIHIKIAGIGDLSVENDKLLTDERIKSNYIRKFEINGVGV